MRSEAINELAGALAKAQGSMKNAPFDKQNPHYRNSYASLASIRDAMREPFAANGLSCSQTTEVRDAAFVLVTTLLHSSGQWIASEYPLPAGAKPQELGSALTYARRYSLSAIACIAADEDDDAEGARTNGQTASTPKPSAVKPAPVAPPVNPETGEVSPHKIVAADVMAWGAAYVAAIKSSTSRAEVEQWANLNKEGLDILPEKIADRVQANVNEKLASFSAMIAAE